MYWEYKVFDTHLAEVCADYEPFGMSWLISMFVFFPYYITIGLIAVSLYQREKFLKLVGAFLTVDMLLNTAVYYMAADLSGESPCGDRDRGIVPSSAAEQSTVFAVMMIGLFSIWKRDCVSPFKVSLLAGAMVLPTFSRLLVGVSTPGQTIFGTLLGFFEGETMLFLTQYVIWPKYSKKSWVVFRYRLKLKQTMCEDVY